jgi:L-alanine-DL-glutamate epimerase-like enolase superfamily enzyme
LERPGARRSILRRAPGSIADARRRSPYTNELFVEMYQYHTVYLSGQITPEGEDFGINVIAAIREAVGPKIGVLLDAHGHYNVFLYHKLDVRGDQLFLSDRPGLGVDLDVELLEAKSFYRRPGT